MWKKAFIFISAVEKIVSYDALQKAEFCFAYIELP